MLKGNGKHSGLAEEDISLTAMLSQSKPVSHCLLLPRQKRIRSMLEGARSLAATED